MKPEIIEYDNTNYKMVIFPSLEGLGVGFKKAELAKYFYSVFRIRLGDRKNFFNLPLNPYCASPKLRDSEDGTSQK